MGTRASEDLSKSVKRSRPEIEREIPRKVLRSDNGSLPTRFAGDFVSNEESVPDKALSGDRSSALSSIRSQPVSPWNSHGTPASSAKTASTGISSTFNLPASSEVSKILKSNSDSLPLSISCLTQPTLKVRQDERTAHCTTVVPMEQQPKRLGTSNLTENERVQTTVTWSPVSHISPHSTNRDQERLSVQPGHCRIGDREHDSLQQLLEEEELLGEKLEVAQQIRQRCELREQLGRREYRRAHQELRAACTDCDTLNHRKELLASQVHAAEARHCSVKFSLDRPSLTLKGTFATNDRSDGGLPLAFVSGPHRLPVGQVTQGSLKLDGTPDHYHSSQPHQSLALSSARVDNSDAVCSKVQSGVSTGMVKDYPSNMSLERASLDRKQQIIFGPNEDSSVVRDKRTNAPSLGIERQARFEAGIPVQVVTHAKPESPVSCSGLLNNAGVGRQPSSANLDKTSCEVPDFAADGQNLAGKSTRELGTKADVPGDSGPVRQSSLSLPIIQSSEQRKEVSSGVHGGGGCSSVGTESAVYRGNEGNPVYTSSGVYSVLDSKPLARSDLGHHYLGQVSAQDLQTVDALRARQGTSSLAQDVGLDPQHVDNEGELDIVLDTRGENDKSANELRRNCEESAVPRGLNDYSVGVTKLRSGGKDCLHEVDGNELPATLDQVSAKPSPPNKQTVEDPWKPAGSQIRGVANNAEIGPLAGALSLSQLTQLSVHDPYCGRGTDMTKVPLSRSTYYPQARLEIGKGTPAIEVSRKALADANVSGRWSSNAEGLDASNFTRQNREEVSEQIPIQAQPSRLEHLLDMIDVRGELSVGGDTLVQERVQCTQFVPEPLVRDIVQLDSSRLELEKGTFPYPEQAQVADGEETAVLTSNPAGNNNVSLGHWVPSAVSLAVLSCIPGKVTQPSDGDSLHDKGLKGDGRDSQTSFEPSLLTPQYESPLTVLRSYRICSQLSGSLHLSPGSGSWSHAIDPFKPLCQFEHRGKCNNHDCPWQHVDDYTLSSCQLMSHVQKNSDSREWVSDDHVTAVTGLGNNVHSAIVTIPSPTMDSSVTEMIAGPQLENGIAVLAKSSVLQSSVSSIWKDSEAVVPIYFRDSSMCMLKVDDPTNMSHLFHGLDRKVETLKSFLLSPYSHWTLTSDMPCLLDEPRKLSLVNEASDYETRTRHSKHMGDMQQKLVFPKVGAAQELVAEDMWLELALHHINFDISSSDSEGRDKALFYLSRALELKPSSGALWVAYSCLFHTRADNPEKDDMFSHAIRYNQHSYELWLLYINSRSDLPSRLKAYEEALVALSDGGTQVELDREKLSAWLLDVGLQMLYCMSVSGHTDDFILWVDELICDASDQDEPKPSGASTRALLSHLTIHDACVLWIACTYFSACTQLPASMIMRFGSKQDLPHALEWDTYAKVDELSCQRVFKALSTAASRGRGCLALEFPHAEIEDRDLNAVEVLGVNYIQCLAFYEGLDSAACLGQRLMELYPNFAGADRYLCSYG